jgi:hypothetical protein
MTTINPPNTFTQGAAAGLAYDYAFAEAELLMAMHDALDPIATGMVALLGDVAGSRSDTIRITNVDNIGMARRMSALATETDAIPASSFLQGYTEAAVGLYGLAHEESYQSQILGTNRGVDLMTLMTVAPGSFLATLRYLGCVTGATIATTIGSASSYMSVDDLLALQAAVLGTSGAMARGLPSMTLHNNQYAKLLESARTEPAFQNSASDFATLNTLQPGAFYRNVLGLGMDARITEDVQTSGGGYQGFAGSPGFLGWVRASTANIRPAGVTGEARYIPDFGLFLQGVDRGVNGSARYEARAWVGTALGSADVFFQRKIYTKA